MEGQTQQQQQQQQAQQQQAQQQAAAQQQQQQQQQQAQQQQHQALLVNTNIPHQMQVVQGNAGGGGGQGDGSQVMDGGQVVSSVSSPQQQQQTLLVNTANIQHQMQVGMSTPQSPLCSAGNTLSTIQAQGTLTQQPVQTNTPQPQIQQVSDWNAQRVQVLQQPVQNTAYVQQVYNAQGQMLMSGNLGNIALHTAPPNMNQSIQVITASKPFQSNQITSHVLGKPVIGAQQTSFPSYATIPTTTNQTLVIGQLGVISSQPSILPHSQQKQSDLQKFQYVTATCQNRGLTTATSNGVQLPWQFNTAQIPQAWVTSPHHPQVITAQNPIFIRGPQQEPPMFIQSPPPQQQQQQQVQQQVNQNVTMSKANTEMKGSSPQVQGSRTLSILPSVNSPAIRPASVAPVSAQLYTKQQGKTVKTKTFFTKSSVPIQKLDAQNQTKPISPQQPKMIITSQGTVVPQQTVQPAQQEKPVLQQQQILQPKPPTLMSLAIPAGGQSPKEQPTQPVQPIEQTVLIAEKPVLEATAIMQESPATPASVTSQDSNAKPEIEEEAPAPVEEKSTGPPKAMVKPQVLTHVIEGYVIQESSEPFPINRNSVIAPDLTPVRPSVDTSDEPPLKKAKEDDLDGKKAKCEACGIIDLREKFRKGKKFCSAQCAKKGSQAKKAKEEEAKTEKEETEKKEWDTNTDTNDSSNSVPDLNDIRTPNIPGDPTNWGVDEVCEFIKSLPGCKEYVEDFASQEIDGQALLLLKEDHLMSAMAMKLGPALKICARIDAMRTKHDAHNS